MSSYNLTARSGQAATAPCSARGASVGVYMDWLDGLLFSPQWENCTEQILHSIIQYISWPKIHAQCHDVNPVLNWFSAPWCFFQCTQFKAWLITMYFTVTRSYNAYLIKYLIKTSTSSCWWPNDLTLTKKFNRHVLTVYIILCTPNKCFIIYIYLLWRTHR